MAFEDDFRHCMPHSITHSTYSTLDGYGKQSFSATATTYSALIQYDQKLVRSFDGTEKLSTHNAIMNSTGSIDPNDLLTLPDGSTPPILSVLLSNDSGGQHHAEVFFG